MYIKCASHIVMIVVLVWVFAPLSLYAQSTPERIKFEQPRLKLSMPMPSGATFSRRELPTYDEVVFTLTKGAGELTIWTYSRRFHSAAELITGIKKEASWNGPIELRKFGTLPGFLLKKNSGASAELLELRVVMDRPGFDWVYLIALEAKDQGAVKTLLDALSQIESL